MFRTPNVFNNNNNNNNISRFTHQLFFFQPSHSPLSQMSKHHPQRKTMMQFKLFSTLSQDLLIKFHGWERTYMHGFKHQNPKIQFTMIWKCLITKLHLLFPFSELIKVAANSCSVSCFINVVVSRKTQVLLHQHHVHFYGFQPGCYFIFDHIMVDGMLF